MNIKLISIVTVFLLFVSLSGTNAGIVFKHHANDSTISASNFTGLNITHKERKTILKKVIRDSMSNARPSSSGWEGIVALCCGILGLVTGYLAIPAIIFGAIGMGRHKRHRGMAIAGFVLGVLEILILILALIFVFTAFALL